METETERERERSVVEKTFLIMFALNVLAQCAASGEV